MKSLIVLLISLLPFAAVAQRVDTLSEAQATAPRLRSTGVVQHAIDSAAILRQSITSLTDALRRLPGVTIRDYGGAGGLKTVSIRGFGASHSQFLIDDLPISNAQQGAVDLSRYDLNEFLSIGITVGDAPQLLCSATSCASATLHASTFPLHPNFVPAIRHKMANSSGVLSLSQSSWNGWQARGQFKHRFANSSVDSSSCRTLLQASALYSSGDNNFPFLFNEEHFRRAHSHSVSGCGQLQVRTLLPKGALEGSARYWQSHRQLPGPVIYYNPDPSDEQTADRDASVSLRFSSPASREKYSASRKNFSASRNFLKRASYFAAIKYNWQDAQYVNPSPFAIGPHEQSYGTQHLYASWGLSLPISKHLSAAYSADYTLQTLNSHAFTDDFIVRNTLLQALSAQFTYRSLRATVRLLDHISADHTKNSVEMGESAPLQHRLMPSLTIGFSPWRLLHLRAFYKEYFRAPTFNERYYYHMGSPTLQPELTRQGGIGLALEHPNPTGLSFRYTADAYMGHVRNRIVSIPYNLFLWRTLNRDSVRTMGVETLGEMAFSSAHHRLSLTSTYTFQHVVLKTPNSAEPYQLPYTPRHSGSIAIGWENPWMNTAISLTAVSSRWTTLLHAPTTLLSRYHEINFSVWRSIHLRSSATSLTLRGEILNLSNQHYYVIARYPMPGISYKVTATFSF